MPSPLVFLFLVLALHRAERDQVNAAKRRAAAANQRVHAADREPEMEPVVVESTREREATIDPREAEAKRLRALARKTARVKKVRKLPRTASAVVKPARLVASRAMRNGELADLGYRLRKHGVNTRAAWIEGARFRFRFAEESYVVTFTGRDRQPVTVSADVVSQDWHSALDVLAMAIVTARKATA